MAHKINDVLNKAEGKLPVPCNENCEFFAFPHLDRACILSEVYSVNKGELCYEFKSKNIK